MSKKPVDTYFDRYYTGPRGPHLGSRTYFTIHNRPGGPRYRHLSIHNKPVYIG